jgi:GNAT superfamily N-acetyltransferase
MFAMETDMLNAATLEFHPLTPERWPDLEKLFGKRGACGGCWCMFWRLRRSDFVKQKGEVNRKALKRIVDSGEVPGILAYANHEPIGWCSFAPRESLSTLERSRILRRVDDKPVRSVVCFFIARPYRRKGLTVKLLEACLKYVREHGDGIVEGYPVDPVQGKTPDVFAYTGLAAAFRKAGFVEVARRSATRPIMRHATKGE